MNGTNASLVLYGMIAVIILAIAAVLYFAFANG